MNSSQIRQTFLTFFEQRGHRVVPSSSLVPANDPTLLFTNAGMNQFKDVFLGREKRGYSRGCSSQKCVRAGGKHNDLEQVGRTTRHHTFFEMLGNFSFGDYFKKEAIPWAWELVTREYNLPREKLYVTVFREDDEAEAIWARDVGVSRERIFRRDEADNFWAMGETGPCGPCSEIHYDLGPAASDFAHKDCSFPCDCGRYVELWNLVFMQFNRDESGKLTLLPRPSIDTGAGLERLAAVLQDKISNFDTDLFCPLIEEAAALAKTEYGANPDTDLSLRIIADHARAATLLISDGLLPSNEGRGYVLRKSTRRAMRRAVLLGQDRPVVMTEMVIAVEKLKSGAYPELTATGQVVQVVADEERKFHQTLKIGLARLEDDLMSAVLSAYFADRPDRIQLTRSEQLRKQERVHLNRLISEVSQRGGTVLYPGEKAFKLYDTFGLPRDFIEDVCRDAGISFDSEGFDCAFEEQRVRAKASWKGAEKKAASPAFQQLAERAKT